MFYFLLQTVTCTASRRTLPKKKRSFWFTIKIITKGPCWTFFSRVGLNYSNILTLPFLSFIHCDIKRFEKIYGVLCTWCIALPKRHYCNAISCYTRVHDSYSTFLTDSYIELWLNILRWSLIKLSWRKVMKGVTWHN